MNIRLAPLVVLAAAVTLTSVAAGGREAAKQRVAIDMKIFPRQRFQLTPLQAGSLKRDSGRITNVSQVLATNGERERTVMRDGQKVSVINGALWTLEGKRGPSRFASGASGSMSEAT